MQGVNDSDGSAKRSRNPTAHMACENVGNAREGRRANNGRERQPEMYKEIADRKDAFDKRHRHDSS